jgi:F0F1-type ATP synthase assembly protein I
MYWPLLSGFIAFILITILLGWLTDAARRGGADRDTH